MEQIFLTLGAIFFFINIIANLVSWVFINPAIFRKWLSKIKA
jgi:hypothetical protein